MENYERSLFEVPEFGIFVGSLVVSAKSHSINQPGEVKKNYRTVKQSHCETV